MRLTVDKIASATRNVPLRRDVRIAPEIIAREGYIVAGRIRGEKSVYNQLEDVHGRMVTLHADDIIVGVLGPRNALHGYSGFVPDTIRVGESLHLLNLGGVIGRCTSQNPDVGPPFVVEILGAVQVFPDFQNRAGIPAHIGMNAITWDPAGADRVEADVPVVFIAGTCMNSGKTSAACQLIRQLDQRRIAVGGCKLTGVSLRRDTLNMLDFGAQWAVSFNDAGIVSTTAGKSLAVAHGLVQHLTKQGAQVIVAELGDGILGEYGVQDILSDGAIMKHAAAIVLCANDPVGAWGGKRVMHERFGLPIAVISGPATDNEVGVRFIREQLQLEAINARTHGAAFGGYIYEQIKHRLPAATGSANGTRGTTPADAGDHAVEIDA